MMTFVQAMRMMILMNIMGLIELTKMMTFVQAIRMTIPMTIMGV